MFTKRLTLFALVLSVAACRCDRTQTQSGKGEIDFVFDQGGTTVTAPSGDYDFNKVAMGTQKTLKLTVQNRGGGSLDLNSLEKVDGDAVTLGDMIEPQAV